MVLDRDEKVIKRFIVKIDGTFTNNGEEGKLVEDFVWSDGKTEKRVWFLEKETDKNWTGKADGVIGSAKGIVSGNSLNWKYAFNLVMEDSVVENLKVNFNDWIELNKIKIEKRIGDDKLLEEHYSFLRKVLIHQSCINSFFVLLIFPLLE